jgi:hypothetical protein
MYLCMKMENMKPVETVPGKGEGDKGERWMG